MSGIRPGFNGLPSRPQGLPAQPQAGPSRQTNHNQRRAAHPQQRQQQQAQPGYPNPYPNSYPYAQVNASGGYQPYPGYQASAAYMPYYQQSAYQQPVYAHYPTATPEGYSYSSTYQPTVPVPNALHSAYSTAYAGRTYTPPAPPASATAVPAVKSWRNCSHPGCKFVGSGEDVEIHEGDRHLIFPNGKPIERSEEEEKWAQHKGPPPPIEGTGIVLGTEEDIAKWIAERKAKWPSAKRVAEREEERQAAIARGENPDRGRGRGRGGARGGRRADAASQAEDWGRPAREESTTQGSRGGGRGRGQERGRGSGRGRGARHHQADQSGNPNMVPVADSVEKACPAPAVKRKRSVSIGSEASDSESETSDGDTSSDSASDDDDTPEQAPKALIETPAEPVKPTKPTCHAFVRNGRCKMGAKCRYSHSIDGKPHAANTIPARTQGPKQPQVKRVNPNPFDRPSMLGALLATPIQNTLSQLTQTIRFLVANNMLEGVEMNPGEAEEQARAQTKVTLVEDVVVDDVQPDDS